MIQQTKRAVEQAKGFDGAIDPLNKGLGEIARGVAANEIPALGWNLLNEDVSLPAAVLFEEKLANNLKWMQQFLSEYDARLAPHGKTSMAPRLFARQLAAGAWGITLATAHQTCVAYAHGVRRVLMANQLVGKQNIATIAKLLEDDTFEYFCLVDSAENVAQLGTYFQTGGRKLSVLIEIGVNGGRTGVRNQQQLESLLTSLNTWGQHISIAGIELYEGVLDDEQAIRDLLRRTVSIAQHLERTKRFGRTPFLVSGAGSAWYDVVAEEFAAAKFGNRAEIVLRPGCYLTQDVGAYRIANQRIQTQNPIAKRMQSALQPALQVWAYVQSVPESRKAIVGLGKRDSAFDAGLPTPVLHHRPGRSRPMQAPAGWRLTKMMDQHAYLEIGEGDDIRVGDMLGFDISHPCLTFDKWRFLCVIDEDYRVIDVVQTFF